MACDCNARRGRIFRDDATNPHRCSACRRRLTIRTSSSQREREWRWSRSEWRRHVEDCRARAGISQRPFFRHHSAESNGCTRGCAMRCSRVLRYPRRRHRRSRSTRHRWTTDIFGSILRCACGAPAGAPSRESHAIENVARDSHQRRAPSPHELTRESSGREPRASQQEFLRSGVAQSQASDRSGSHDRSCRAGKEPGARHQGCGKDPRLRIIVAPRRDRSTPARDPPRFAVAIENRRSHRSVHARKDSQSGLVADEGSRTLTDPGTNSN
jgi:hypothetical protein